MTQLLLATPVRAAELPTALVSLGYSDFRLQLAKLLPFEQLVGHATFSLDVCRARNRMVGLLLSRPEFATVTHVLWVDDDTWPEDVRIVPAMVERCRGVLFAPYTNKREPVRWVHRSDGERVLGCGFGFTMTTRACLEAVAYQGRWYTDAPNDLRCPNVFGQLLHEQGGTETLLSEDYSFCVRARAAGYEIEMFDALIHHAGGHVWNARARPTSPGDP